jgi:hypothetical protein
MSLKIIAGLAIGAAVGYGLSLVSIKTGST